MIRLTRNRVRFAPIKKHAREHARGEPVMEKTRIANWLIGQGYRLSSLPSKVTWFTIDKVSGKQRGFITHANDYNLNFYRGKGYVLNPKLLDPQAWHELEYGGKTSCSGRTEA
jgi:hypothetical protein